MNRLTYSICLLIISILPVGAQKNTDPEKVISSTLNQIRTSAVEVNFILKISQKNAVNSQTNFGTFTLKGNKFMLEMTEMKVWFDGKNQWSYISKSNEVSITQPTEDELVQTNPMAILSNYKAKCQMSFSKAHSAQNYIVDMIPKDKNDNFTTIEVQIEKASGNLKSIKLRSKNGQSIMLTLSDYHKGIKVSDDFFVFPKAKYKNAIMNDLR